MVTMDIEKALSPQQRLPVERGGARPRPAGKCGEAADHHRRPGIGLPELPTSDFQEPDILFGVELGKAPQVRLIPDFPVGEAPFVAFRHGRHIAPPGGMVGLARPDDSVFGGPQRRGRQREHIADMVAVVKRQDPVGGAEIPGIFRPLNPVPFGESANRFGSAERRQQRLALGVGGTHLRTVGTDAEGEFGISAPVRPRRFQIGEGAPPGVPARISFDRNLIVGQPDAQRGQFDFRRPAACASRLKCDCLFAAEAAAEVILQHNGGVCLDRQPGTVGEPETERALLSFGQHVDRLSGRNREIDRFGGGLAIFQLHPVEEQPCSVRRGRLEIKSPQQGVGQFRRFQPGEIVPELAASGRNSERDAGIGDPASAAYGEDGPEGGFSRREFRVEQQRNRLAVLHFLRSGVAQQEASRSGGGDRELVFARCQRDCALVVAFQIASAGIQYDLPPVAVGKVVDRAKGGHLFAVIVGEGQPFHRYRSGGAGLQDHRDVVQPRRKVDLAVAVADPVGRGVLRRQREPVDQPVRFPFRFDGEPAQSFGGGVLQTEVDVLNLRTRSDGELQRDRRAAEWRQQWPVGKQQFRSPVTPRVPRQPDSLRSRLGGLAPPVGEMEPALLRPEAFHVIVPAAGEEQYGRQQQHWKSHNSSILSRRSVEEAGL